LKRALISLSLLLNLLVLGIIVWFFWGGGLMRVAWRFIGPAQERWVSQFEVLPVAPGSVVFLGDSITEGGKWHELFPDEPVHNRGIGGDVTTGVLERLHQVTQGRPAKVFLMIGTNDLAFGRSEDEIIANMGTITARIRAESPGTQVYLQSVLPRDEDNRERIESLNDRLRTTASEQGATFVDLYPLFLDEDGSIRDELANDELHLMGAGYEIWRDAIAELVREGLNEADPAAAAGAP